MTNTKKLIGTLLLCFGALIFLLMTALGAMLGGLIFGAPLLLCGIVCLVFRENTGLWCAWAVFFSVNVYLRYGTGITWRLVLLAARYEPAWNTMPMRLAFAWVELICFVLMIGMTVLRFRKKPLVLSKGGWILYAGGWIVFALLFIPLRLDTLSGLAELYYIFWDWLKVGLGTALLSASLRLIRTRQADRTAK